MTLKPGQMHPRAARSRNTTDAGSTPLDASLARRISPDLAKALARLSKLAEVSSGSYCLSAAASSSFDAKGKGSSMTSEQRKAHKRFMLSLKARAIDWMAAPRSPSERPSQGSHVSRRCRLRLGECVVFLPSRRPDSDGSWFAVPRHTDNLAADGTEATSLITQLDVLLAETCLLVHATTRHIALQPLSSIDTQGSLPRSRPRLEPKYAHISSRSSRRAWRHRATQFNCSGPPLRAAIYLCETQRCRAQQEP